MGKYKSKFEQTVAAQLRELGAPCNYEGVVIYYIIPESVHRYIPDFPLGNGVVIEAKGKFDAQDRKKHALIKQQHPKVKICIVFQNANQRLSKKSKTTYAMWCDKHNIEWSHKQIKKEWIDETIRRNKRN